MQHFEEFLVALFDDEGKLESWLTAVEDID